MYNILSCAWSKYLRVLSTACTYEPSNLFLCWLMPGTYLLEPKSTRMCACQCDDLTVHLLRQACKNTESVTCISIAWGDKKMNPMPGKKLRNVSKRKGKMGFQLSSITTLAFRWSIHISHQTHPENPRFWHTSKWRSSTSQSLFCCPDLPDRGHCRRTSPDLTTCTIFKSPSSERNPTKSNRTRTTRVLPKKKTQSQLGLGGTTPNTVQQIERSVLACKSPAGFPSP